MTTEDRLLDLLDRQKKQHENMVKLLRRVQRLEEENESLSDVVAALAKKTEAGKRTLLSTTVPDGKFPEEFRDAAVAICKREGVPADQIVTLLEWESFYDYWTSTRKPMIDWRRTWLMRIRKRIQFHHVRSNGRGR